MTQALRFGLVGTGHWAQITHAPALASADGIEFAAVWGRNSGAAADLAGRYHATAYDDISAFLANVDAVAFAVPPGVQARSPSARPRRASTCCLKSPLRSPRRMGTPWPARWSRPASHPWCSSPPGFRPTCGPGWPRSRPPGGGPGGARCGWAPPCGRVTRSIPPGAGTRAGCGTSPRNLISLLWASLGPVRSVTAQAGPADVTHLILRHEPGATSTVTVTLNAPTAQSLPTCLFGEKPAGRRLPSRPASQ